MTIFEQADSTGGRVTYSWMISRGYNTRSEMERWGWRWIAGHRCRGVFVTNNPAAVTRAMSVLRLSSPSTNGSHTRVGAPMAPLS